MRAGASRWGRACAVSWLAEKEEEAPPLGEVRQALKALEELRGALKDCADLAHRIDAMEHDRRKFAAEVGEVAVALELARRRGRGSARRCDRARVAAARENARRREEKTKALERRAQTLATIVDALAVNAKLVSAMTEFFAVATLAEVAAQAGGVQASRRAALGGREGDRRHHRLECRGFVRSRARGSRRRRPRRARTGARRTQNPRDGRRCGETRRVSRPTARHSGGSTPSAATTRSRGSRRSGARSSRRSRMARGAISRCARGSQRRTRR